MVEPRDLVGSNANDPADVLACMHERFIILPPGISPYDWEAPGRPIPNPPSIEGGPFIELRLANSPEGAWAGLVQRLVASDEQPLWQVLKDLRHHAIYRIEAPGVRIKDRHADGQLVGGPLALRKTGEEAQGPDEDGSLVVPGGILQPEPLKQARGTSRAWEAIATNFEEPIVAIVLPDDSPPSMTRPDWPIIAATTRLDMLVEGPLKLIYQGQPRIRIRDVLRLKDAAGRPIGRRFAYFIARELAHDFFSPRRHRSRRDWLTLAIALLPPLGAIATLVTRLIELAS